MSALERLSRRRGWCVGFDPRDCWVGVFWTRTQVHVAEDAVADGVAEAPAGVFRCLDVYACAVPMVVLHAWWTFRPNAARRRVRAQWRRWRCWVGLHRKEQSMRAGASGDAAIAVLKCRDCLWERLTA